MTEPTRDVRQMIEALAWYAQAGVYRRDEMHGGYSQIMADRGQRARICLTNFSANWRQFLDGDPAPPTRPDIVLDRDPKPGDRVLIRSGYYDGQEGIYERSESGLYGHVVRTIPEQKSGPTIRCGKVEVLG